MTQPLLQDSKLNQIHNNNSSERAKCCILLTAGKSWELCSRNN